MITDKPIPIEMTLDAFKGAWVAVVEASDYPTPNYICLDPVSYRAWVRFDRIATRTQILLRDAVLRSAWMAGWQARAKGRYSERRKQKEWNAWCEQEAARQVDSEIAEEGARSVQ